MAIAPFWQESLLFLLVINVWTILRFWQDKCRARAGLRRIPEANLLGLALLGGSPGALAARSIFRHKTRKQPFSSRLHAIILGQILLIGAATILLS